MEPSYIAVNRAERQRLLEMLDRLSDNDLERRLPNGLSIVDVLIHMAFWDRYARDVLAMWQRDGFSSSQTHYEAINTAVLMLASAIPTHIAVEFVRDSAEAVDHEAEMIAPDLAQAIIEGGKLRTLERGQHRREHLDQIEQFLATT